LTRDFSTQRVALTQTLDKELAVGVQALEKEVAVLMQSLEKERTAVMGTVEKERAAIMRDVDRMVRDTTERSWQNLRAMVKDVLLYVVLLVVIVLGLPFVFGYLVGRATGRWGRLTGSPPAGQARPAPKSE
jgi:hypothetical protein